MEISNPIDLWILSKLQRLIERVDKDLENYRFNTIVEIYKFVWHEFCDNYIEMVKYRLYGDDEEAKKEARWTLYYVIDKVVRLLCPFAPHFSDYIAEIYKIDNLHFSFPEVDNRFINEEAEKFGEIAKKYSHFN